MRFLLLLHVEEAGWGRLSETERTERTAEYLAFNDELAAAGAMISAARLAPSGGARTVQTKGGRTVVMDGPFAETKEQVGGYYLIEAADLAVAAEWAAKCPATGHGAVEVRALFNA